MELTDTILFTEKNSGVDIVNDTESDFHHNTEAIKFANDHRKARKLSNDQEMMVALAYSSPFQIKQAKLFPTVFHIDCTADTNKEGRPLLTITAKDSNAKFFTVVQCFLPNEKGWSFKWFFQNAVPVLISLDTLMDCKYVVTDGDQQLIQQLEDSIQNYMPWARRGRCSWHIIDRGWANHVNLPLGGYSKKKGGKIKEPRENHLHH